jgi:hypothetical protein
MTNPRFAEFEQHLSGSWVSLALQVLMDAAMDRAENGVSDE